MRKEDNPHNNEFLGLIGMISRQRRIAIFRGCVSVLLTVALTMLLMLVPVMRLLSPWSYAPFAAWLVFWGMILAGLVNAGQRAVTIGVDSHSIADAIGKRTGKGSLFSSAFEFSLGSERLDGYSPWFISETIRRAAGELRPLSGRELFASTGRPGWILAGVVLSVAFLLVSIVDPAGTAKALEAVSDPTLSFRSIEGLNLRLTGSDRTIVAGDDLTVEAVRLGRSQEIVSLSVCEVEGVWVEEAVIEAKTDEEGLPSYRYTFTDVKNDLQYRFLSGSEATPPVRVTVLHRPVINSITARMEYPRYTGAAADTIATLSGRIAALRGTIIHLEGETSRDIVDGSVLFASGKAATLDVREGGFRSTFELASSDTMRIDIIDSNGLRNVSSLSYPLVARDDDPPTIEVISPDDETVLPRSLLARLLIHAADDFGITSITLKYRKEGSGGQFSSIPVMDSPGAIGAWEEEFLWQIDERLVFPGDRIAYYLEARDNNSASGPGISKTPVRILIAPSMAQVFAESRMEEQAQGKTMEDILEESEEVRDRLSELVEELKATGEMDWENRKESREILQAQEELGERIKEAADALDETLQRLEDNRMTSMEVGKKMEEIRDLLREIASEEIREAMDRLASMLEQIPDSEIAVAMDQVELDSQEIADKLDRTIDLLKQILREEQMEELVRRMEDMLQQQADLKDSTETGDLDELADKQRQLEKEYKDFEEAAREFAEENSETDASEEMENMTKEMDSASLDSTMSASADQMEASQREESSKTQGTALSRMMSLFTEMGKCQMAVSAKPDLEARRAMERATWDVLETSRIGEGALPSIRARDASARLDELLEEQNIIREATRIVMHDLLEAGRKSAAVSNEVFSHLAGALHSVDLTLQALQARRFSIAATLASRTPRRLNEAAIELLKSTSSSGGGMGGSMQQMKQMMQQQSSIDQRLRQLMRSGQQGMSMEQRAEMARIAAEQRKMGELMKQVAEESKGAGELLGSIDDLGEEMEQIAKMLDEGNLDKDLMEREERILSRMLESQRSLNRRDYSRQRISRTGSGQPAVDSRFVPGEDDETRLLLERIRSGMREKGPAEYQDLIEAYFRALSGKVREDDGN